MKRTNIDRSWELIRGEYPQIPGMSPEKRIVNLPHDFIIEGDVSKNSAGGADVGYYNGGTATYTKYIQAGEEWTDKRVLVQFDGVFGETSVILNGHVVGKHHYGYTPFVVDLTKQLKAGQKNRLSVTVSNDHEPNSRWYSGAGIYRHVDLLTAPKVHIAPDGIYAYTDHIVGQDAFVVVETTVENHTAEDADVWVNLLFKAQGGSEAQGRQVQGESEVRGRQAQGSLEAQGAVKVHVPAGESAIARTQLLVEDARIWDIDDPQLYRIAAQLVSRRPGKKEELTGTKVLDEEICSFGIRTISIDAKNGFRLNGRSLKLKGGCIHHDNGILGAASFADSEYRKVKLHKENGYNALRFAHNPVSRDMLDACDRLGIVVIDEAFDTWNMPKNLHDFSRHFASEWEQELTGFLIRDRNHPSVIIWSIGNELREQGGLSQGYQTSAMLAARVRQLDHTRFVAGALCSFFSGLDDEDTGSFWSSLMQEAQQSGGLANLDGSFGRAVWNDYTECFCAPWDVVGYNYLNYHYDEASELFPNRVICATESKPGQMEEYWEDVLRLPNLIGDFEWTSHDYIGEAGIGKRLYVKPGKAAQAARMLHMAPYPWRTAGAGEFDLCGFYKPQLAYRRIIWGSPETYIACQNPANMGKVELLDRYAWQDCLNSWTWPAENKSPIRVEVYSAAEEVELILNGRSLGRQKAGKENHYKAQFELTYERGILEAVSYTNGQEISRDSLESAGAPAGIKLTADPMALHQTTLPADGQSLCFAVITVVDENQRPVPYAETEVHARIVSGTCDQAAQEAAPAEKIAVLAALGSGRPMTEENYTVGRITTYEGRALAVIRSGCQAGNVRLKVTAKGMAEAFLDINVTKVS